MAHALAKVRRTTEDFFGWWFAQLKGLVPARVLRLISPPVSELLLELNLPQLVLRRRNGGAVRELGAVNVEDMDPEEVKAALQPILADLDLNRMRVCLRLPANRALRKIIDLPIAAEENLRQVLAFEMDRLTPFAADAVHYDVHVIGRDIENRRIRAELMVLPRATVDPSLAQLRRLGFEPDAVALPRGDAATVPWRVPLATEGTGGRRLSGRAALAMLVLAIGMFTAGVFLAFDRQNQRLEILDREVTAARKDAEEGRALQEEIERLSVEGDFIVNKKRERPPTVEVLSELTRVLADDTWLYRLRFLSGELQTFGYSPNASALIGLIENSVLFANAQFRAPLTRDQRMEAEQFHVAFQVAREAQP